MRFQFLLQTLSLTLIPYLHGALLVQNSTILKPSCMDRCGNITIPYPFGTTPDCYHSNSFWVTCDHTVRNPPKLFWQNKEVEIKNISLDGQMTVMQFFSSVCAYPEYKMDRTPNISLPDFFAVNKTVNKFTIVGCDSYGFISGEKIFSDRPFCDANTYASCLPAPPSRRHYATGCTTSCMTDTLDLVEGSCMGMGCCQMSIPENVREATINVFQYGEVREMSNCTYGFVVEESAFKFYPNLTNLKGVKTLPLVVDWVIGNMTCDQAINASAGYACKSENSVCFKPQNVSGYRCQCQNGYQGNPYLTNGCQDIDECTSPNSKELCAYRCFNKKGTFDCLCPKGYRGVRRPIRSEGDCRPDESHKLKLIAGISLGTIFMLLIACLAYLEHNRRQLKRAKKKYFLQNGGDLLLQKLHARPGSHDALKIFNLSELKKATNDFHKDNIVGRGGFGTVYRGLLSNNQLVAIKKSQRVDQDQIEQFVNEVIVLYQINHRNIVKLLGCCLETEVPHLVYEFISNGTLYAHLHDPVRVGLLNWENRLRIAAETADVLAYLHSAASNPIIHRDVKSENILLDNSFTAKVSDFGASRLIPLDQTQISTVVLGTRGYLDPEYLQTNQLTAKSDVYSFGVVLLELITGRSAVRFSGPEDERSLVKFSISMMKQENFFLLVDGCIAKDRNREQIMEVARIAKWCVKMRGEERPDMKVVAMELESLRLGRKLPLVKEEQNDTVMQALLGEEFDGVIANGGGSNASAVGSSSSMEQVAHSLRRGR